MIFSQPWLLFLSSLPTATSRSSLLLSLSSLLSTLLTELPAQSLLLDYSLLTLLLLQVPIFAFDTLLVSPPSKQEQ